MKTIAAIIVIEIIILSLQTCHLQVGGSDFRLKHPDECGVKNQRHADKDGVLPLGHTHPE